MHTRRVPRLLLSGVAATLAVTGLAGCRTSPAVAAYVGDATVSVDELRSAVDERLDDQAIAAYAEGQEDAYTRQVLTLLVREQVYAAAAEHWDVRVTDDDVRQRIATLLAGSDENAAFQQAAQEQGASREDVFENVRQQLVRQAVAQEEGLDDAVSEQALRQQYEQDKAAYQQYVFGYIAVPDQPVADSVLARLTADPASYPEVAAPYDNGVTLPQLETRPADQLPQALSERLLATQPGTGFTLPVPDLGVVVAFLAGIQVQPFEEVRGELEGAAAADVNQAAGQAIEDFQEGMDITVNPRYGVLDEGAVVEGGDGVVDLLDSGAGGSGSDPAGTTGG